MSLFKYNIKKNQNKLKWDNIINNIFKYLKKNIVIYKD